MSSPPPTPVSSLFYISTWILLSSLVIIFNKWILDRFPFAISLTTWHMLFATIATQVLARTTSLIDHSVKMDAGLYLRAIVPIGMCFSLSLVLSNVVYLYLSIGFIQMLKSFGPVATLLSCWSLGIHNPPPSLRILLTVCTITLGVALASIGELHFLLAGFLIQAAAIVFEAYNKALQQRLLGGNLKMSSMTLLYYYAPACTVINLVWVLAFEWRALSVKEGSGIPVGIWILNGCLTFGLNLASVAVIKKTSSVVLTLSGIPKSILLTLIDMAVYNTAITVMQGVGFSIAGAGTFYYSQITQAPVPTTVVAGAKVEREVEVDVQRDVDGEILETKERNGDLDLASDRRRQADEEQARLLSR